MSISYIANNNTNYRQPISLTCHFVANINILYSTFKSISGFRSDFSQNSNTKFYPGIYYNIKKNEKRKKEKQPRLQTFL